VAATVTQAQEPLVPDAPIKVLLDIDAYKAAELPVEIEPLGLVSNGYTHSRTTFFSYS
jgi:hypothetical protein